MLPGSPADAPVTGLGENAERAGMKGRRLHSGWGTGRILVQHRRQHKESRGRTLLEGGREEACGAVLRRSIHIGSAGKMWEPAPARPGGGWGQHHGCLLSHPTFGGRYWPEGDEGGGGCPLKA